MLKLRDLLEPYGILFQICHSHGLHLGVGDTLYPKKPTWEQTWVKDHFEMVNQEQPISTGNFDLEVDLQKIHCNHCNKFYKSGAKTGVLVNHLVNKHSIEAPKAEDERITAIVNNYQEKLVRLGSVGLNVTLSSKVCALKFNKTK